MKPEFKGRNHHKWKGDNVGYRALHNYLRKAQKQIFLDNTLSTVERHKKMSEYIEDNKRGDEN